MNQSAKARGRFSLTKNKIELDFLIDFFGSESVAKEILKKRRK